MLKEEFRNALLPFQREGILFGLERGGQCLIADEMGVGKTVQAIALAACYRDKWPLLVVLPASLRLVWAEELEKWLPDVPPSKIYIIFGREDRLNASILSDPQTAPQVVITSYTMLEHLTCAACKKQHFGRCDDPHGCMASLGWKLVVADESHALRTAIFHGQLKTDSRHTEAMRSTCFNAEHRIFLTGTPSLNKPFDLYSQVTMIRPDLLPKDRALFGSIYCDRKLVPNPFMGPNAKRYDYSGVSRGQELHILLKQEVMIRRLKIEVLDQLPAKRRQVISLPRPSSTDWPKERPDHQEDVRDESEGKGPAPRSMSNYHKVGLAKCSMGCEWLFSQMGLHSIHSRDSDELIASSKVVVFVHHKDVMNKLAAALDACLLKNNANQPFRYDFVRVDGENTAQERHEAVIKFREDPNTRVALLSITAAGFGLDFSSADKVVFFELPPDAASVKQAEDRVHRRGQQNSVNIYFLCARSTTDERHWQRLNKSLATVGSVHDGFASQIDPAASSLIHGNGKKSHTWLELDSVVSLLPRDFQGKRFDTYDLPKVGAQKQSHGNEGCQALAKKKQTVLEKRSLPTVSWCFEVSKHTDRVHIYRDKNRKSPVNLSIPLVCLIGENFDTIDDLAMAYCSINGTESEPRPFISSVGPLFINIQVINTEKDFRDALKNCVEFANEWHEVSTVHRSRLYNRCIRPPLDIVLEEEILKIKMEGGFGTGTTRFLPTTGGSGQTVDFDQATLTKIPNIQHASWHHGLVTFGSVRTIKYRQMIAPYTSVYSDVDDKSESESLWVRLCIHCYKEVPYSSEAIVSENLASPCMLYCSNQCEKSHAIKSSSGGYRRAVFERDRGICEMCHMNCAWAVKRLQAIERGTKK